MATTPIQALYDQLCSLLALEPRSLAPDPQGMEAFCLQLDGVPVSVVHLPHDRANFVHAITDLPGDSARTDWSSLLTTNLLGTPLGAPQLGRNPATGQAVLRVGMLLPRPAEEVLEQLSRLVELAAALAEAPADTDPSRNPGVFA